MCRFLLTLTCGLLLIALLAPIAHPARADDKAVAGDDKLVGDVKKAIDEAIAYLRSVQSPAGHWEVAGGAKVGSGGTTALVLLALFEGGVKPTDKNFKAGLDWLRKNDLTQMPAPQTYCVALQTMVFCAVKDPQDRKRIEAGVKFLLDSRYAEGWSYQQGVKIQAAVDYSNTQYALLGLHEAARAGVEVDRKALQEMQASLIKRQQRSGGWGYNPGSTTATTNMTTAGLCNLIITGLDLAEGKAALRKDGSAEKCGEYAETEAVQKAVKLLGEIFPGRLDDGSVRLLFGGNSPAVMYGMYGIERSGRFTGQRYFGGHDWYEVGCRWLVEKQKHDGHYEGGNLDGGPIGATSFALLFLSKGRTPILISKMAYGEPNYTGWNNKRNDMKHAVEYVSRALFEGKQPLAWQAFDVRTLRAENEADRRTLAASLRQSPIVFVNGHDYAPRDKEQEILKEYINDGGFLLAENCCGKSRYPDFDKDFARLIKAILPDAELKLLEPEHPIWTASGKFASSPRDFPLMGVKQGCKTVAIYSPVPLAGYWEANAFDDKGQGQKTFELLANIVAYATGLEVPRPRLSRVEIVVENPKEKPKRGYLKVAQLRHEGDWQPAPKAMRNLMQEARKEGLDVALKTDAIYPTGIDDEAAVLNYRFLYMHGRSAFASKKEDLKQLRFLLKNGGFLLADACCGSKTFDASFRKFIDEVFGEDKLKLEPIPAKDELFGVDINGKPLERVRRRVMSEGKVSKEFQSLAPELEGVKYKGRWVVVYSKTDIGCALEKHASSECLSHDYESAMRIGRAALLYALKR